MSETSPRLWNIGLSPWIILDGNYKDFAAGDVTAFALEFSSERGLQKCAPSSGSAKALEGPNYDIVGRVTHSFADWWVIDFGLFAFSETEPQRDLRIGDYISGQIYIGIDPFFYFTSLSKIDGAPPLIYDWRIDAIEREICPLIEHPSRANVLVPDKTHQRKEGISKTDAWHEDSVRGQSLDYELCCRMLGGPRFPKSLGSGSAI